MQEDHGTGWSTGRQQKVTALVCRYRKRHKDQHIPWTDLQSPVLHHEHDSLKSNGTPIRTASPTRDLPNAALFRDWLSSCCGVCTSSFENRSRGVLSCVISGTQAFLKHHTQINHGTSLRDGFSSVVSPRRARHEMAQKVVSSTPPLALRRMYVGMYILPGRDTFKV